MATDEFTQNPSPDNPTILARDAAGAEQHLRVTEDTAGAGLIILRSKGVVWVMNVEAGLELAHQIIELVIKRQRGDVGPLSSRF